MLDCRSTGQVIDPDIGVYFKPKSISCTYLKLSPAKFILTVHNYSLKPHAFQIAHEYVMDILNYYIMGASCRSERIGWIPFEEEVPKNLVNEYRWIFGLSITEMEIVHGAYRKDNPNCEY